jgi:putative spermidine/putrescine transport system ATP-binding protein
MALRIDHVSKSFGKLAALIDVDLEFPHGKLICLLGPSGCGKTTLLRCIAGLETPTAGRIWLDGQDVTDAPAHKRNFGMVFQSLALFPHLSVGENIAYGLRIRGVDQGARSKRAEELLELVRLPGVIDRPVSQLSGGQRQRVAIARALVNEPEILIADEPTGNLDPELTLEIMDLIAGAAARGTTVLVATHDHALVERFGRRVIRLEEGRLVADQRPAGGGL